MYPRHIKSLIGSLILTFLISFISPSITFSQEQTLLYKIEGKGIHNSYLFGTLHLLPKKDFLLTEKVKKAFDQSEQVVLELDMNKPMMKGEMAKTAKMNDDYSIDMLMSPEYYAQLDAMLPKSLGKNLDQIKHTKPFMLQSFLIQKAIGAKPMSFESTFQQWAKQSKKETYGLETAQEQLSLFDNVDYHDQAKSIMGILDDFEGMADTYLDMIDIYKNEDVEEMYDVMMPYFNEDAKAMDRILHKRNQKWAPRIIELARQKSSFVGVGTGHLGGDQGLIALLKESGYKVSPVYE